VRRVLVTGATTPFGRTLIAQLLADGEVAQVLAVGREPEAPWPSTPRLEYLRTDLSRIRQLRELLFGPVREQSIDTVVLAAFHRHAPDSARTYRMHVEAPRELLRLAERHPSIRQLVYCSSAEVYRVDGDLPCIVAEDHPLALGCAMPERIRERIETDQLLCAHIGSSSLIVTVLRLAEIFAPASGSQLYDYFSSRVCLRPLGYDPMINLVSIEDAARATALAIAARRPGIYNIPGGDTLPLSAMMAQMKRWNVPVPGPLLDPLYGLRRLVTGRAFRYQLNASRLHFSGLLDGSRAAAELGYRPTAAVSVR
jgi:UDP-glucose 4-epimerase